MKCFVAIAVLAATLSGSFPAAAWDPFRGRSASATPPSAPPGLYLVTDVYSGDTVVTTGATTTYGTTTVRDTPGTYARVLARVSTGEGSVYDGRSINARRRLPDGRLVAGAYYEDFVLTSRGYVSVNIVFFQDDSLTAAAPPPTAPPAATTAPRATPVPSARPAASPPRPTGTPVAVSAGIALEPGGPVLARIEVLRGRPVELWPRIFVGGAAAAVRSWRLLPGSGATAAATTGAAGPCGAAWLALPPPQASYSALFEVTTDALPGRVLRAAIEVGVRSPALIE